MMDDTTLERGLRARPPADPVYRSRLTTTPPTALHQVTTHPRGNEIASSTTIIGSTRQGRFGSMSSASKVITKGVIVTITALGATGVIRRLDRTGQTASVSPESSAAPMVGDDWAFFSGTLTFDGQPLGVESTTHEENGLVVSLGGAGWRGQTMVSDDPRMTGERTDRENSFEDTHDRDTHGFYATLYTIENAEGAWTCPLNGVAVGDVEFGDVGFSVSGWCTGTGGYDGLRAYIVFDIGDEGDVYASIPVYGFITSGEGLPFPEAPTN